MRNTEAIIERVRARTDTGTNYAVSKALGMSQSNLARVLKGGSSLGNEACFRAAALLDMDPADVIAYVEEDRAPTPEKKEFWRTRLPRVLPTVAAAALAIVGYKVGAGTDGLAAFAMLAMPVNSTLLYIMCILLGLLAWCSYWHLGSNSPSGLQPEPAGPLPHSPGHVA